MEVEDKIIQVTNPKPDSSLLGYSPITLRLRFSKRLGEYTLKDTNLFSSDFTQETIGDMLRIIKKANKLKEKK